MKILESIKLGWERFIIPCKAQGEAIRRAYCGYVPERISL